MYDASIRRFTAIDPVRGTVIDPQTMVQYTYVLNNPLRFIDSWGLFGEDEYIRTHCNGWIFASDGSKADWASAGQVSPPSAPSFNDILDEVWEWIDSMTDDELLFAISAGLFEAMGVYIPSGWLSGLASDGHIYMNDIRQGLVDFIVDAIIEDSSGRGLDLLNGWVYVHGNGFNNIPDSDSREVIIDLSQNPNTQVQVVAAREHAEARGAEVVWTGNVNRGGMAFANATVTYNGVSINITGQMVNGSLMINRSILDNAFGWDAVAPTPHISNPPTTIVGAPSEGLDVATGVLVVVGVVAIGYGIYKFVKTGNPQTVQAGGQNLQQAAQRGTSVVFGSTTKSSQTLATQMQTRGWTEAAIRNTVNNPYTTRSAINRATGNDATAFFNLDGSHVIIDNITREVVQISNRFDPAWIPDSSIINPFIP